MKTMIVGCLLVGLAISSVSADAVAGLTTQPSKANLNVPASTQPATIYQFTMKDIDGRDRSLADYRGKVLLVVNVASKQ